MPIHQPSLATPERQHFHSFQLALSPGDVLVLTDYSPVVDPEHVKAYESFVLTSVEHSPRFRWQVQKSKQDVVNGSGIAEIHPKVQMGANAPFTLVNKKRGLCTLFRVRVAHGYSLHFRDYIQRNYPLIAEQFALK